MTKAREFGCVGGSGPNSLGPIRRSQVWKAQPEGDTQEESNVYSRDLAKGRGAEYLPSEGDSWRGGREQVKLLGKPKGHWPW